MKKASTAKRALRTHFEVAQEFIESLSAVFPDDAELKDFKIFNANVVVGDEEKMLQGVEAWCSNMQEPLKKGSAKYMKAVESIVGSPATVYHAFKYRDTAAMAASSTSETFRRLDLHGKMVSQAWDEASKNACWEYLDELNRTAFEAVSPSLPCSKLPYVPTREEIEKDIAARKASSTAGTGGGGRGSSQSVQDGIKDLFQKVCALRGVACTDAMLQDVASKLAAAAATTVVSSGGASSKTAGELCRDGESDGFFALVTACADDGVDWGSEAVEPEAFDLINKCVGLATMKASIPTPMLAGIEDMANKLVGDLASGKTDLSSLNVEEIGQQVLSQVSPQDMQSFAGNIDKILPALGQLKPM